MPVLVCGVGFFLIRGYIGRVGDKLPGELAKLKALGIPTEPADLAPKPPIPDSENAAELYRAIGAQFTAIKSDADTKDIRQALERSKQLPGDDALVRQGLQKFAPIFSDAEKLLGKQNLDYKRNYALGFNLLFPEYAEHKRLCKWVVNRARVQMSSADFRGSLRSLHIAFQIAQHDAHEPTLIGSLVSLANNAIAFRGLEEFLVAVKDDPAMLAEAQKMLASVQPVPDMKRAFSGELVLGRKTIQSIRRASDLGMDPEGRDRRLSRIPITDPIRRMFDANYCEVWRRAFEKFPEDGKDWRGYTIVMNDQMARVERNKSLDNIVNQIIFPVFDQALLAFGKVQAERKLGLLAIQMLLDRKAGLPADLGKYGDLAIDPLTGRAFGYKRDGKGFRIWSVGRDLKDNGGVRRDPKSKSTEGIKGIDIVLGFDTTIPLVP